MIVGSITAPIAGVAVIGMLMGGFLALDGPDGGSLMLGMIILGVVLIGLLIMMVVGLIFGIVAIRQKDRKKVFGILGTSLNGAFLLLLLFSCLLSSFAK